MDSEHAVSPLLHKALAARSQILISRLYRIALLTTWELFNSSCTRFTPLPHFNTQSAKLAESSTPEPRRMQLRTTSNCCSQLTSPHWALVNHIVMHEAGCVDHLCDLC